LSVPRIAVLLDPPDEDWRAMDLAGEMLVREWRALPDEVRVTPVARSLPRFARRFARSPGALNADRLLGRFAVYPAHAARLRGDFDFFHVVDHSYAQLVHALAPARTGVFCHDIDAFRARRVSEGTARSPLLRAVQGVVRTGLRRAAVVFYSTESARREIESEGLVAPERLVWAPYGISAEFDAVPRADDGAEPLLARLEGHPFLLHVGSALPRKRLDVLFDTFARLRPRFPDLRLVQNGAWLDEAQLAHLARASIAGAFFQPSHAPIPRSAIAGLYRRARAVLVTSDAEGFGLPVIEALACGAVVFASDIPVLREVGGDAVIPCRVGDPEHWAATVGRFLDGTLSPPPREARLAQAARFSWSRHARVILDAYRGLGHPAPPATRAAGR
jgi:glycosyltransferase involved in cell wall biosynthesis